MAAAIVQPDVLETTIRKIVDSVPLPKGVRFLRITFDSDHSGDPAVYIFFGLSTKIALTKTRSNALRAFKGAVTDPISKIPSGPIPYIRFEDVR